MRIRLLALAALLVAFRAAPAADPPIVFQVQPVGQVIGKLNGAASAVAGQDGVKAMTKAIKEAFGEKGFEGMDQTRPIVGYVVLAPKPEDITAVVALPVTDEKDFLALCDRVNRDKLRVDEKDKALYHLPPLDPPYKAMMRFSNQYAYIAYGFNPAPHVAEKELVPVGKLYDPAERSLFAGRIYFDRIPLAVKLAAPALLEEVKKNLLGGLRLGREEEPIFKAIMPEVEKLVTRYAKLAGGGDVLSARFDIDVPNSNVVVEAKLNGKPDSDLAKIIAARKPTANQFGSLLNHPDTVIGFRTRLPLFEDEIKAAAAGGLEEGRKQLLQNAPPDGKAVFEELFKGLTRTVKTGEFDIVAAMRGPDKDGVFTWVGAVAFEDPANLEKEFRKLIAGTAPQDIQDAIKWDAAKAGDVGIHTWTITERGWINFDKAFGDPTIAAFAFAPKGVLVAMGPDAVAVLKDALAVKPVESPVLDIVVNPARIGKLVGKVGPPNDPETARIVDMFGKEDKVMSAVSLAVTGGKELKATLTMNLKLIPRWMAFGYFSARARVPDSEPIVIPGK